MRRVLVTGSRKWRNYGTVVMAMTQQLHLSDDRRLVVVHGGAPGVDRMAESWCNRRMAPSGWCEVTPESHPARWEDYCPQCPGHRRWREARPDVEYCPAQGGIRNQRMVDLGADICLGFPIGEGWSGTRDCMTRAEKAGIPVLDLGVL